MKKKIMLLCAIFSLFTIVAFAAPDYNNPATETGMVSASNAGNFYVNGYNLESLTYQQKIQLQSLIGKTITVKGYYEKKPHSNEIDDIYVTMISTN